MDVTRNHGLGQVPEQVEMNPTDHPELSKPFRNLENFKLSQQKTLTERGLEFKSGNSM